MNDEEQVMMFGHMPQFWHAAYREVDALSPDRGSNEEADRAMAKVRALEMEYDQQTGEK